MRASKGIAGLLAALTSMACAENVDIDARHPDAAAAEASASDAAPGDAFVGNGETGVPADKDGSCRSTSRVPQCAQFGQPCAGNVACCFGRCQNGFCPHHNNCSDAGAPCAARSECCSGRCEPVAPTGVRACTPTCKRSGEVCSTAASCCSLGCHGGFCDDEPCRGVGNGCVSGADCCSGKCTSGHCAGISGACLASGELCGGDAGVSCCSGVDLCSAASGRCDLGPGLCREDSTPCTSANDCCSLSCLPGFQGAYACRPASCPP